MGKSTLQKVFIGSLVASIILLIVGAALIAASPGLAMVSYIMYGFSSLIFMISFAIAGYRAAADCRDPCPHNHPEYDVPKTE